MAEVGGAAKGNKRKERKIKEYGNRDEGAGSKGEDTILNKEYGIL